MFVTVGLTTPAGFTRPGAAAVRAIVATRLDS
jgi:hypothetical protein